MGHYAFEPMDNEGRTVTLLPPLGMRAIAALGMSVDEFVTHDPILRMAADAGLSPESVHLCRMGAFDVPDLVDHMPTLRPLIERHGERDVVMLCQDARGIVGSSEAAVNLVARFFSFADRQGTAKRDPS